MSVNVKNGFVSTVQGVSHSSALNGHHRKDRKRKPHRRREQIKELRETVSSLEQQLTMRDERISDLEQSNSTVRQTLKIKDQTIQRLKVEIREMRRKMNAQSH